jgi:hypothetical protein
MGFMDDVKKHMGDEYPDTHPKKVKSQSMKTFAIHIPEQTVYTTAMTLEEAEDIAMYEYANLHDDIKETKEND